MASAGACTRRMPANFPARCAMRLSSQFPPARATASATASTSPGRSEPTMVITTSCIAFLSS